MTSAGLSPTKDIKSKEGKLPNQWTGEQKCNFIVENYLKGHQVVFRCVRQRHWVHHVDDVETSHQLENISN